MVGRATQPSDGSSLRPQLNLFDAVATDLAAILGAGIFYVNGQHFVSCLQSYLFLLLVQNETPRHQRIIQG